jgi:hypothetical protein
MAARKEYTTRRTDPSPYTGASPPLLHNAANVGYPTLLLSIFLLLSTTPSFSSTETGRQYSYTLYDSIGRITEVGQIANAGSTAMTDSISRSESILTSWLTASAANKEQITSTIYDIAYPGFTGLSFTPIVQRNLRNRVAYTSFTTGSNPAQYNQGTFYTYDIEGNVDTLLQDYGSSSFSGLRNKS